MSKSFVAVFVVASLATSALGGDDLISLVIAGQRQNRGMVRTFQGMMTITPTEEGRDYQGIASFRWWETEKALRTRVQFVDGSVIESLTRDSRTKQLITNQRKSGKPSYQGTIGPAQPFNPFSPWLYAMMTMGAGELCGEYVRDAKPKAEVRKHESEVIEAKCPGDDRSGWDFYVFDPKYSYLATTYVSYRKGIRSSSTEIIEFTEPIPGFFFPRHMQSKNKRGQVTSNAIFSEIRVNQMIPDEIFRLEFPEGTAVSDYFRNEVYDSDKGEMPAGPAAPMPKGASFDFETVRFPTDHPSKASFVRRYRSWLWGFAGLFVLGAGAWVVRTVVRRRREAVA